MKADRVLTLTTTFEGHAQQTEEGVEYYLARDLQYLLGYLKWDNFLNVISKARTACEVSGHQVSDHFADAGKTISMPKGAEKEILGKRNPGASQPQAAKEGIPGSTYFLCTPRTSSSNHFSCRA